jgi:hypothetical protein
MSDDISRQHVEDMASLPLGVMGAGNVGIKMARQLLAALDLLDAIDALHQPGDGPSPTVTWCKSCDQSYPCMTARLLHPKATDE